MHEIITRRELLAAGKTDRWIRRAIERGELRRLREGRFAAPDIDEASAAAIRVGGHLACISELRRRGIWVLDDGQLHVAVARGAAPLRSSSFRLHWSRHPSDNDDGDVAHVAVVAALAQASRCLGPVAWLASVDSALHLGAVDRSDLAELRRRARPGPRILLDLVDARAESGLETIVRVIARELGFAVRVQVDFRGVGRVDLVVEDWVVVETDGTAFHGVSLSARDRARDARLAAVGKTVLRPGYALVVFDRVAVARQLIGAVATHRRVKDSGHLAARALRRLSRLDLS